jgi:hypothetical protein
MRRFVNILIESLGVGLICVSILLVCLTYMDEVTKLANGNFSGNLVVSLISVFGMMLSGVSLIAYADWRDV